MRILIMLQFTWLDWLSTNGFDHFVQCVGLWWHLLVRYTFVLKKWCMFVYRYVLVLYMLQQLQKKIKSYFYKVCFHCFSHMMFTDKPSQMLPLLGSRISPHHHRVVVEVHWRGAQGWRSISWVVATFSHVGGSFNLSMAATGDVWIIPSFRIWGYLGLAGEKHYQKITIPILFFKILLFQVTFLLFFSTAIFSPYFLQVGLLLQYVALFQSGS